MSLNTAALTVAVPVIVGVAAVYLLLPKPHGLPRWLGAVAGVAALALFGAMLLRDAAGSPAVEAVLFYSFSALALLGGVSLVTQQNPARGAVSFALVVLATSGLFLLQAAPFVMAGTIIIYAGAIVVTFLFVIMLSQQRGVTSADARSREPLLACVAGGLLLFLLAWAIVGQYDTAGFDRLLTAVDGASAGGKPSVEGIREAVAELSTHTPAHAAVNAAFVNLEADLTGPGVDAAKGKAALAQFREFVSQTRATAGDLRPSESMPLSAFGGPPDRAGSTPKPLPAGNVAALGRLLFSDYILAVEMAGTLLLVATVAAIAISHHSAQRVA